MGKHNTSTRFLLEAEITAAREPQGTQPKAGAAKVLGNLNHPMGSATKQLSKQCATMKSCQRVRKKGQFSQRKHFNLCPPCTNFPVGNPVSLSIGSYWIYPFLAVTCVFDFVSGVRGRTRPRCQA